MTLTYFINTRHFSYTLYPLSQTKSIISFATAISSQRFRQGTALQRPMATNQPPEISASSEASSVRSSSSCQNWSLEGGWDARVTGRWVKQDTSRIVYGCLWYIYISNYLWFINQQRWLGGLPPSGNLIGKYLDWPHSPRRTLPVGLLSTWCSPLSMLPQLQLGWKNPTCPSYWGCKTLMIPGVNHQILVHSLLGFYRQALPL